MRKIFLALRVLNIFGCNAQTIPPTFNLETISLQQTENLYKLGKIWGFLKYHHPEVAKGKINWDDELFRVLPLIDSENFEEEINAWIKGIGKTTSTGNDRTLPGEVKLLPNTDWLEGSKLLGEETRMLLLEIKRASPVKKHRYIDFVKGVANPIFQNEKTYPDMQFGNTAYQLLALYRYWNMVEYFFPYKYLTDKNWDEVLMEFIPKIVAAKDELSYKLTLLQLIGEVKDTHANILKQDTDAVLKRFYGEKVVPVELSFIEGKPVVVRLLKEVADETDIKIGDVITSVNGVEIKTLIEERLKFYPASNYPTQLRDVARKLLRTNEDNLKVTIENSEGIAIKSLRTVNAGNIDVRQRDIPSHQVLEAGIGYIYPASLKVGEINSIMKSFMEKKGIVIDLRCYPSDYIVYSLGNYLMPEPTEFAKFTLGSLEMPGLFTWTGPMTVGSKNKTHFKGKVMILINEMTQSQAEYTTMALRVAPKAKVIGSTTAGADGNFSSITLPGNIYTGISGIGVYYPDGTGTQRVGIIPDIPLMPTIEGIRNGKDELLELALELIRN